MFNDLDHKVDNIVNMNILDSYAGVNSLLTEELTLQSNFRFILFGLNNLKVGGSFATVHCIPYSQVGKQLIYILAKYFSNVYCLKTPYGSSLSVNYNLVAMNFQGISDSDLDTLKKISRKWELSDPSNGHMLNISQECLVAASIESPYKFMKSIVNLEHNGINLKIENMINLVMSRIEIRMLNLFFIDNVFISDVDSLLELQRKLENSQKMFVENLENLIYIFTETIKKKRRLY